jgi:CxxC-x17-CxxC domain-containing protein
MESQDQNIMCSDCNQEFVFTTGERQFYIERGFEYPPKRCKPCRAQRKQQASRSREPAPPSSGNSREANYTGYRPKEAHPKAPQRPREGGQRPQQPRGGDTAHQKTNQPRDLYVTTCQACGDSTKVPFKPQEGRGVYCPECYHALKALNRASLDENFS